jgi:hypothetical protein
MVEQITHRFQEISSMLGVLLNLLFFSSFGCVELNFRAVNFTSTLEIYGFLVESPAEHPYLHWRFLIQKSL